MVNHSEWQEDQNMALQRAFEERERIKRELDKIINTYEWITVKRYYEKDPEDTTVDWKEEYKKLIEHHKAETEFLIAKVREYAKKEQI